MAKYITSRQPDAIILNSRVTSISLGQDGKFVDVIAGGSLHQFSHVISTIPLPVLRTLDLSGSKLTPMQSNALRQLSYAPAIKIGLQFRTAWWTTGLDKDGKPLNIVGGQSYTDRLVRIIVYPSAGDVQNGKTTTLIASYCRHEDAVRLVALVENDKPGLIKIVLRDLAEIHNVSVGFLEKELIDSIAWSWTSDVNAMGEYLSILGGL
jgi:monoamine oxidase